MFPPYLTAFVRLDSVIYTAGVENSPTVSVDHVLYNTDPPARCAQQWHD